MDGKRREKRNKGRRKKRKSGKFIEKEVEGRERLVKEKGVLREKGGRKT